MAANIPAAASVTASASGEPANPAATSDRRRCRGRTPPISAFRPNRARKPALRQRDQRHRARTSRWRAPGSARSRRRTPPERPCQHRGGQDQQRVMGEAMRRVDEANLAAGGVGHWGRSLGFLSVGAVGTSGRRHRGPVPGTASLSDARGSDNPRRRGPAAARASAAATETLHTIPTPAFAEQLIARSRWSPLVPPQLFQAGYPVNDSTRRAIRRRAARGRAWRRRAQCPSQPTRSSRLSVHPKSASRRPSIRHRQGRRIAAPSRLVRGGAGARPHRRRQDPPLPGHPESRLRARIIAGTGYPATRRGGRRRYLFLPLDRRPAGRQLALHRSYPRSR